MAANGRRTQLLRGVLDLCLLAVIEESPAYGYEMTKRLRARGLEQDQRERRRTVDDVRSELALCQERYEQSERAILQAESEAAPAPGREAA